MSVVHLYCDCCCHASCSTGISWFVYEDIGFVDSVQWKVTETVVKTVFPAVHSQYVAYLPKHIFKNIIYWPVLEKWILLCPQYEWQSIVMSVSVCLSVCDHISGTTDLIFKFFVHVTYGWHHIWLWLYGCLTSSPSWSTAHAAFALTINSM